MSAYGSSVTLAALAVSYAALAAAILLVIRRARRRTADAVSAVEAYTAATARAVAINAGCGQVWHQLDLLKHGLNVGTLSVLESARIRLEQKTGMTAGKRSRLERNLLRTFKKLRAEQSQQRGGSAAPRTPAMVGNSVAVNDHRGRMTVTPITEGGSK